MAQPPLQHTYGSILGTRIRERRRQIGMAQSELARLVNISPSYLNLIESNKRQIAGSRLRQIAEALGLTLEDLTGSAANRLADELTTLSSLEALSRFDVEANRIGEFVGMLPGWSAATAALARSERQATARAQALSDRMSNDPYLGATVHRMLSRISALRSAAEILHDFSDMTKFEIEKFSAIVYQESGRLSQVGEALASYLDKAESRVSAATPIDEVEAVFTAHENRFELIDEMADSLNELLTDSRPGPRRQMAANLVQNDIVGAIDRIVDAESSIDTATGRALTKNALFVYAVNSILMPTATFTQQAREFAYDIEVLAESFYTEVSAVCRRLTALGGDSLPRFGFLSANAAGTIVEMIALKSLSVPRYADACPLWALFSAQQAPESIFRQYVLFPNGMRFVFLARARRTGETGFDKPRHYLTDMLMMTEEDASKTVYAPTELIRLDEVGPGCRLCPRSSCIHRVVDPIAG